MRTAVTIASVAVVRLVRDRGNLFLVFVFPLLLVLLLGVAFGGSGERRLAVVAPGDDAATTELVRALEDADDVVVDRYDETATARDAVSRGLAAAGLVLPEDYGDGLAAGTARLELIGRPDRQVGLRPVIEQVTAGQATVQRSATALDRVLGDAVDAAGLERLRSTVPRTQVQLRTVGDEGDLTAELGPFDLGASTQLLLFVFVTSLSASAALVEDRELGMTARVLSTPTTAGQLLAGQAVGRYAVALIQGLYIVGATWLIFGVDWGDPAGAALILLVFSAVSAGAAMLLGSLADNDAQASGLGLGAGLGLAALGGSMVPLAAFPDTMRTIAHVTPHAWGNDAFSALVRDDGTVTDILPHVGILAAMAIALFGLATVQLRRRISGEGD